MKKITVEENKKNTMENIKKAKSFIAITNDSLSICGNKLEIMSLVATMFEEFVKNGTIDKEDIEVIIEVTKNNIENKEEDLDSILDRIAKKIVDKLFEGEK